MKTLTKTMMMIFCLAIMMSCSANRKVSSVNPPEMTKEEKEQTIEDNINWQMNLIRAHR